MLLKDPTTPTEFAVNYTCDMSRDRLLDTVVDRRGTYDLSRNQQFERLGSLIGDTNLIPTGLRSDDEASPIYTKLEFTNISGSHYDRAFLATIKGLEQADFIKPGDELRDITSGSGGISLATMAWALGYKSRITVPSELPKTRLWPMDYFGAEIIDAGPGYMQQASSFQAAEIVALKADPNWTLHRPADREQRAFLFENGDQRICYLNHSENRLSPDAFASIGHELVAQLAEPPNAVMLAMGNWTTIAGIAPVLRQAWPDTSLVGYRGENTVVHDNFGTTVDGIPLRFRDESLLDEIAVVSDEQRDIVDRRFNGDRNLFWQVGHSTLMGLAAAQRFDSKDLGSIVTIGYDQKIRY